MPINLHICHNVYNLHNHIIQYIHSQHAQTNVSQISKTDLIYTRLGFDFFS